jgi:cytoplasmic tRNA 2-thiolation protein 1
MKCCSKCSSKKIALKRMKDESPMCKECFLNSFEEEVHETIMKYNIFSPNDIVAVGVSGGKGFV